MGKFMVILIAIIFISTGSSLVTTASTAISCYNAEEDKEKQSSNMVALNAGGIVMGLIQIILSMVIIYMNMKG